MLRKLIVSLVATIAVTSAYAQGVPVYDNAAELNWVQQLVSAAQQLTQLENQYKQLQQTYAGLNGLRDISKLLNNNLVTQTLPADAKSTLSALQSGTATGDLAGISGSLSQIQSQNQVRSCTTYGTTVEQQLCQKQWQQASYGQYVGQAGYAAAGANINNLQQFLTTMQQGAPDPKSMQDFQARVALEQVKQQNEATKLNTVKMMQDAQDRMDRLNNAQAAGQMLTTGTGIRF